jgi:hypothetical protein
MMGSNKRKRTTKKEKAEEDQVAVFKFEPSDDGPIDLEHDEYAILSCT